jgi:hypothetical protein
MKRLSEVSKLGITSLLFHLLSAEYFVGSNDLIFLVYDVSKSAFQAFCKHGFDMVHKFIGSCNSAGVIPICDKHFSSRNVHAQIRTKVALSDLGFLTFWRFRK